MTRVAEWVATLGPVGYWPWGPGTVASALVVSCWWAWGGSALAWGLGSAFVFVLGAVTSGVAERKLGRDDGRIVIDEVAGQALALALAPHTSVAAAIAFVLFRAFDIGKPPPIDRFERLHGGWGVMLDDLLAALPVMIGLGLWNVLG